MNERLLQALETYHGLAKTKQELLDARNAVSEEREGDKTSEMENLDADVGRVDAAIAELEKMNARKRGQTKETQEAIFALQEKKMLVMKRLRRKMEMLDDPEGTVETEKGDYHVSVDEQGRMISKGVQVTEGMILTDPEWGIRYKFDSRVPRRLQRRYFLEEAKHDLRKLADQQIVEDMLGSGRTSEGERKAFSAFKELRGSEETVSGWVAERLVKSIIGRIAIDFDLDIEVIDADVYEDVRHKIDFVIRRKSRLRGVDAEASRSVDEKTGIQFTMQASDFRLNHKRQQIERVKDLADDGELRVKDIVLVSLPMGGVLKLYEEWERKKRKPGGPAELWKGREKEEIFKNVLKDIMTGPELEAQWRLIEAQKSKMTKK